jgi:OHCU decarboxylase
VTVDELDWMAPERAAETLRSCCGSSKWVSEMVAMRPFRSFAALSSAADAVWARTGAADWREAFSHHPRIGECTAASSQSAQAAAWSSGEQAGMQSAVASTQNELAAINRSYENRFGHIYIVCASGKSAEELLAIARSRLSNDAEAELRVAAEEQRKITQLRLKKLFGEST